MTSTKLGRVEVEDHQTYFFLLEIDRNSSEDVSLSIIMTNIEKCWKSQLDSQFLRIQSERTKCSIDKYLKIILTCLTGTTTDETVTEEGSKYICQVKELPNNDAELTWKVQLLEDISFKMGTTTLRLTNTNDDLRTILSFGVNRIKELEKLTEEQQSEEKRFLQEEKNFCEKLESCVTSKEEMERDLYSKFVTVLNEKKAEIRRLRSHSKSVIDNGKIVNSKKTKQTDAKKRKSSDPDDLTSCEEDENYDTPITRRKLAVVSMPPKEDEEDLLFSDSSKESLDTIKVSLRSPTKKPKQISSITNRVTKRSSLKSTVVDNKDVVKASTSKASVGIRRTRSQKLAEESGRIDSANLLDDMQ